MRMMLTQNPPYAEKLRINGGTSSDTTFGGPASLAQNSTAKKGGASSHMISVG